MGDSGGFDINAALKVYIDDAQSIPTPDADPSLLDCENDPDAYSPGLISSVLNPVSEAIGENPEAILNAAHLDNLRFLLKCVVPSFHYTDMTDKALFLLPGRHCTYRQHRSASFSTLSFPV